MNSNTLFDTLPHHIVAHVNSVNSIAWDVHVGPKDQITEQLTGIDWRYIPYAKPGASLTTAVSQVLSDEPGTPSCLILENHGLVFGAESPQAEEALLFEVEENLK